MTADAKERRFLNGFLSHILVNIKIIEVSSMNVLLYNLDVVALSYWALLNFIFYLR